MDEKRYTYRVQWMVLVGSALLSLLLIGGWVHEGVNREWKKHQRDYKAMLEELDDREGIGVDEEFEKGIFQVDLPQFNRIDRCISCHNGLEDPRMAGMPQPHAKHPGTILGDHPIQKYGCTICHGGQGRALSKDEAFGQLPDVHWPYPLLEQPYIQSSCGKCHLAVFDSIPGEHTEMVGMEVFIKGKTLFSREGCLGCHKARGVGGIIGPDLTRQGEKTKHGYSFQNVKGEQTVSNWLKEHFKDPEMVSPGSQMLEINMEEQELEALATFVMGMSKPDIPFDYFTMPTLNEFKGMREQMDGPTGYAYLCSACHGKRGEGKRYEAYMTGIPSIGRTDFIRVASEDFIRFTLEKGRSLRQMGSWAGSVSGMEPRELDEIARFLKNRGSRPIQAGPLKTRGNGDRGESLYNRLCRACHGENGSGDVALALNQEDFLSRADDDFLLRTLFRGRGNTAMPGWSHLDDSALSDLIAAIRRWNDNSPDQGEMILPEADLADGGLKFHYLCSRCHGEFGEGETGPAIINRDFLNAAGNTYLYKTIAEGRAHTAMFGWSADVYNQEKLGLKDITNIIGFMRNTAGHPLSYVYPGSNPGNREAGAGVFATRCAECHGPSGEGTAAPALNNQEFLSAASNGFLMATITLGRNGTAMPSWGYGQGKYPALSGKERQDLVAYLRAWQRIRIKY
jgi:mono/diheme cytochrome c family protein